MGLYLKGVKGNHMNTILDFIDFGSTNVQENQLTTFLVTANELKILGLVETSNLQKKNVNHSPGNSKNDTIGIGANDHITIDDTENGITEQQQEKLGDMLTSEKWLQISLIRIKSADCIKI